MSERLAKNCRHSDSSEKLADRVGMKNSYRMKIKYKKEQKEEV